MTYARDDTTDLALVLGGPLYQLYRRGRLVRPPLDLLGRRITVFVMITWLPLLLLAFVGGRTLGEVEAPFLKDLTVHSRFLIALPLLIAAEVFVHQQIRRVVLCSGKVYVDLITSELRAAADNVAIVRLEQLYPFPQVALREALEPYSHVEELVWLQEEPENMGAWTYVEHRIFRIKNQGYELRNVTRVESGSPATGSATIHEQELADLMEDSFRDL